MNATHLHLMLNHIPVIGTGFALLLLLVALAKRSDEWKKVSLWFFVLIALLTVPAYVTGEPAEDGVKGLPGIAKAVIEHLTKELQMLEMKMEIQSKVRGDMDKQQREYFLNQQLRQIQEELGQDSPDKELINLREKGKEKKWRLTIRFLRLKILKKIVRIFCRLTGV